MFAKNNSTYIARAFRCVFLALVVVLFATAFSAKAYASQAVISVANYGTAKNAVGLNTATSFTRDTTSTLNQVRAKSGYQNIAGDGTDYDTYVYMYKEGSSVYWWSNADIIYLDSACANQMFKGCSELTTINLTGINTSRSISMAYMFQGCSKLSSLTLGSGWNTSNVTSMQSMFAMCQNLENISFTGWDTANVTSMQSMFNACERFTTLNLTGLNTIHVQDMSWMFSTCTNLQSISFGSDWNTENVRDMNNMFRTCSAITSLNISTWNVMNVTDMHHMFYCCRALSSLDVSNWDVRSVTNMSSLFEGCWNLSSINFGTGQNAWYTTNVENMSSMFSECSGLSALEFNPNFYTGTVTDMSSMFFGCSGLTSLDVSAFITNNVADLNNMFYGCSGLVAVDLSAWDTSSATNMSRMFYGCSGLSTFDQGGTGIIFSVENVTNMSDMFYGCSSLKSMDIQFTGTGSVTNMRNLFYTCSKLTELDLQDFNTESVTTMANMFSGCNSLVQLTVSGGFVCNSSITDDAAKPALPAQLTHTLDIYGDKHIISSTTALENTTKTTTYVPIITATISKDKWSSAKTTVALSTATSFVCDTVSTQSDIEAKETIARIDDESTSGKVYLWSDGSCVFWWSNADITYLPSNCSYLFSDAAGLTSLSLDGLNSSRVNNISSMFYNCTGLTTLDLSRFDSSAVREMSGTFSNCSGLTSISFGSLWDTSKVTSFNGLFYGCSALSSFDIVDWDTSNVKDMMQTFSGCSSLTSLNLNSWDTGNLKSLNSTFANCTNLKSINIENWDTSKVTQMPGTFINCSKLETIDLHTWNTSSLITTWSLFENCTSLKSINLYSWDTTGATENCGMFTMFKNCSSLLSLDLSDINTAKVTSFENMFDGCTALEELVVPGGFVCNSAMVQTFGLSADFSLPSQLTHTRDELGVVTPIDAGTSIDVITEKTTYCKSDGNSAISNSAYIVFSSPSSFTLKTNNNVKNWDGNIEYSTNGETWNTWSGTSSLSARRTSDKYTLYLRGTGNSKITGLNPGYNYRWVITGSNVRCDGNIENLLNYTTVSAGGHPAMSANCFNCLFEDCTALVSAPKLLATTCTDYCYAGMFADTSIVDAPYLPATTLATYCYKDMFSGCEQLTSLPALKATTLAYGCYYYMFTGCTSIKLSTVNSSDAKIYRIPYTGTISTTPTYALSNMFLGTGGTFTGTPRINTNYYTTNDIVVAPDEYITFSSSSTFSIATNNNAKNWDGTLYYSTNGTNFYSWNGVSSINAVSNSGTYKLYLRGSANSLITGDDQTKHWVINGSNVSCSGNIENILDYVAVRADTHPLMSDACFAYLFYDCAALKSSPELPSENLSKDCYKGMFYNCISLSDAPELPAKYLETNCYDSMFYNCSALSMAPDLAATVIKGYSYRGMFRGCSGLTVPPSIAASTVYEGGCQEMFRDCTSLLYAPTLAGDLRGKSCYEAAFYGCTTLKRSPHLPALILSDSCYKNMFYGCSSLEVPPTLSATNLAPHCYEGMLYNCSNLRFSATQTDEYRRPYRVPDVGEGAVNTGSLTNMFTGTGGTFSGTPTINTTYYTPLKAFAAYDTAKATLIFFTALEADKGGKLYVDNDVAYTFNYLFSDFEYEDTVPWTYDPRYYMTTVNFVDKIYPVTTKNWFSSCLKLTAVQNTANLDLSNAESVCNMFQHDKALTSIDVTNWNLRNATDLSRMFCGCEKLTSIDIHTWEIPSATNMMSIFESCTNLTYINLSGVDTGSVQNMSWMFYGCENLTTIDGISSLNTNSATEMDDMFYNCKKLGSLDLRAWNVENVTDMSEMFCGLHSAMASTDFFVNLNGWNTSNVTKMTRMFASCSSLTSLDVDFLNTSNVTDMHAMFYGCDLQELDLRGWDTSNVTYMSLLFAENRNLTEIKFGDSWATGNVVSFDSMFYNCKELETIQTSSFDTSNANNMFEMFSGCSKLSYLDVSNFNTANVENMGFMFYDCTGITSLDISNFDTAKVKDTGWMFAGCVKLTTIYASNSFNMDAVLDRAANTWTGVASFWGPTYSYTVCDHEYMFYKCYELVGGKGTRPYVADTTTLATVNGETALVNKTYAKIDKSNSPGYFTLKAINAPYATIDSTKWAEHKNNVVLTAESFIRDTTKTLSEVQALGNAYRIDDEGTTKYIYMWRDGSVAYWWSDANTVYLPENCSQMFKDCTLLTTIGLDEFNTSNTTNMSSMFMNCSRLTTLDFSNWDTSNVADMHNMFAGVGTETGHRLTALDLSDFDIGNVTNMSAMFKGDKYLSTLDMTGWNTTGVTDMSELFSGCSSIGQTGLNLSTWDVSSVEDMGSMFYDCKSITTLNLSGWDTGASRDFDKMFSGCTSLATLDVSGFDTSNAEDMNHMFAGVPASTLEVGNFDTSNVADMNGMFNGCLNITALAVAGWNTSNVTRTDYMFNDCVKLGSLDLSGWDVSNVTNMGGMFNGCSILADVAVIGWDTGSATNMDYIFNGCAKLTELDLGDWDTSSVTSMASMFSGCTKLVTIYASEAFDTESVTNAANMFANCNALVGGHGTEFTDEHIGKEYAVIDTKANPGYFTKALRGDAYAIFDSTRNALVFFRSETYPSSVEYDAVTYSGDVYTGFETTSYAASYNSVPWSSNLNNIETVIFADTLRPTATAQWYRGGSYIESFVDIENLDMAKATDIQYMFSDCSALSNVDVNEFYTVAITNMAGVFNGCSSLTAIDVSDWDTSAATNMSKMFKGCNALVSLDVSNFKTSNVTDMSEMFMNCNGLSNIDISVFDTRNAEHMSDMFSGCSGLATLKVGSRFDTPGNDADKPTFPVKMYSIVTNPEASFVAGISIPNGADTYSTTPPFVTVSFYNGTALLGTQEMRIGEVTALSTAHQGSVEGGYTFYGWETNPGSGTRDYVSGGNITVDGTTSLYAMYTRNIRFVSGTGSVEYVVPQYYYGGSARSITTPAAVASAEAGRAFAAPNAASDGYAWSFECWTTGKQYDSNETHTEAGAVRTPDVGETVFYARWQRTVAVAYDGNGADIGSVDNSTATQYYNSSNIAGCLSTPSFTLRENGFTLPASEKDGYSFIGWSEASTTKETLFERPALLTGPYGGYTPAADLALPVKTVYAVWFDTVAPTFADVSTEANRVWKAAGSGQTITVALNDIDDKSGAVDSEAENGNGYQYNFQLPNGGWSGWQAENSYQYVVQSGSMVDTRKVLIKDAVGNFNADGFNIYVRIDNKKPSITSHIGNTTWTNEDVEVSVLAEDGGSSAEVNAETPGASGLMFYWTSPAGAAPTAESEGWVTPSDNSWTTMAYTYDSELVSSGKTYQTANVYVKDAVGNVSTAYAVSVYMDRTPPTLYKMYTALSSDRLSALISLNATDDVTTDQSRFRYCLRYEEGGENTWTAPPAQQLYEFKAEATVAVKDEAGNITALTFIPTVKEATESGLNAQISLISDAVLDVEGYSFGKEKYMTEFNDTTIEYQTYSVNGTSMTGYRVEFTASPQKDGVLSGTAKLSTGQVMKVYWGDAYSMTTDRGAKGYVFITPSTLTKSAKNAELTITVIEYEDDGGELTRKLAMDTISAKVTIDVNPPTVSISMNSLRSKAAINANDAIMGVKTVEYRIIQRDNSVGAWTLCQYGSNYVDITDARYVEVVATDNIDNAISKSNPIRSVDLTAFMDEDGGNYPVESNDYNSYYYRTPKFNHWLINTNN